MRIPEHAKKVYSGVIFDIFQWQQKFYDGSYRTWEVGRHRPSVDTILVKDDNIMILKQQQPTRSEYPSLSGGRLDPDEDFKEAAKRELLEETGIQAKNWKLFREYDGWSKMEFLEHVFVAHYDKVVSEPHLDGGEIIAPKWITFEEFLHLGYHEKFAVPVLLRLEMCRCLVDKQHKEKFKSELFN